ncbi:MAG TPA: ACT domain-containing protein [Planctomycetota bacterium]|nr:ACT domain-containing protein [Planctomycetota bacterium]
MSASGLRELLARTPLRVRRAPHALASWPPALAPLLAAQLVTLAAREAGPGGGGLVFWCVDERELSALLPQSALPALPAPTRCERDWAAITLDADMAWDVSGVLAAVSGALAAAGIPIGAVTAFSRDHVLVPRARLPDALAALAGLCGEVRADG